MRPFVHLHCHSHYSLLDGAGKLDDLIARAKELEMPALALTDHGNLYGALEFYQKAQKAGIKPIIGYEAYIAPRSRKEKSGARTSKDAAYHLTLLATDHLGYKNLLKLASLACLEGAYYHPRIDKELLRQYSEGLVCLSGCAGSEFSQAILNGGSGGYQKALDVANWYRELFGDRYYIEIQDAGLEIQRIVLEGSIKAAKELGIPTVATNDVHYVYREDSEAQDVLICINTGRFRTDSNRMKMETQELFLRSGDEMLAALPEHKDAIERTLEIADRVDIKIDLGRRYFPVFTPPEGKDSDEYLRELCIKGLEKRYADNPKRLIEGRLSDEVMARLDRELEVIKKLGFPNYFLIVWDFVRVAEERGIHRTARGSGVGALVCYALGMSHVCPLEFDLLFERFLDENRIEAPDIDIDFDQNRRGEILDYVKQTYGEANVAQIGTFGTMAAKMSIKDVGRVLGRPISEVNEISSLVPEAPKMTIAKAFEQNPDLRNRYENDRDVRDLIDLAKQCEGLVRSAGTHACAVVIADKQLMEYLPLQTDKKDEIVTQWAMGDVEKAGLLKMDFLGLRNLSILSNAIEIIKETTGETIDPYRFPLDDAETYALLCRGETKGIFQLEGGGIRELLQRMKPDNFRDIIATLALYRPGPLEGGMVDQYVDVKLGRKQAEYLHPVMEEILSETHGVMVYQEQIMRIINRLGKISLPEAYSCIKAISKKKEAEINKFEGRFIEGAGENGISNQESQKLFDMIKVFAGYGFNKSHSTAYALVAYMTAYLKTHYPVEFMAALLCGDMNARNFTKKDSTVEHVEDCERMGITVAPPDVNSSYDIYRVKDGKIHFALEAIRGVRTGCGGDIAKARKSGGPFKDIFDLCARIYYGMGTRSSVEALIKAGALDSLDRNRARSMQLLDKAIRGGANTLHDRKKGQKSFFDTLDENEPEEDVPVIDIGLPDIPDWADKEKSMYEKEVLGFYVTSHPLNEYKDAFETYRTHSNYEAVRLPDNTDVMLAGIVNDVKLSQTKRGTPNVFAMFTIEDMSGPIRSIIWPKEYEKCPDLIKSDQVVFALGRIDRSRSQNEDDANLIVDEILTVEEAERRFSNGILLKINESVHSEAELRNMYEIIRGYPGPDALELQVRCKDGRVAMMKSKMTLSSTPEMRERLKGLLGSDSFSLLRSSPTFASRKKAVNSYRKGNAEE